MFNCPICSYPYIEEDPTRLTYEICPSCGTEYGYDEPEDYPILKQDWIDDGCQWWSEINLKPKDWNP